MATKSSKLDQRLQTAIAERRFYEVHQLYKTIYFRFMTRRNYTDAMNCLITGSKFLLSNEQWESGIELSCLLIEVYIKGKIELTDTQLNQLCDLLLHMPPGDERMNFVNKALQLLHSHKSLLAKFNEQFARILWWEGSFNEARFRIMLSSNGYAAGCFLIALHERYGLRSEVDLFITQAVLQFLCMRQISVAMLTFYTYTRGHPLLEPGPPFVHFPLLNFLWFLMLAIEKKCNLSVFAVLCEKYEPQLHRDSAYAKYLDKIGQLYFGIPPPKNEANNLFSHILQLFSSSSTASGDMDEDDREPLCSSEVVDHNVMCFEEVD